MELPFESYKGMLALLSVDLPSARETQILLDNNHFKSVLIVLRYILLASTDTVISEVDLHLQ